MEISITAATLIGLASSRRINSTAARCIRYISGLCRAMRRRTSANSTQLPP